MWYSIHTLHEYHIIVPSTMIIFRKGVDTTYRVPNVAKLCDRIEDQIIAVLHDLVILQLPDNCM